MHALVVTGGEAPPRTRLVPGRYRFDLICAADSGLDTARSWGLRPNIIVGDMDSLAEPDMLERYPDAEIVRYPIHKDETDTEIAIRTVRDRFSGHLVLAGGGGGRLDHLLAIRSLFARSRRPDEWHLPGNVVLLVPEGNSISLDLSPGSIVSVFPCRSPVFAMESEGLRWPLHGLAWDTWDCGVSNICEGRSCSIRAGSGDLLVVFPYSDGP